MEIKKISLIILIVAFWMTGQIAMADNYRVLYTNSNNIRIGNQIARKGLEFSDSEKIVWTSDNQALKLLNLSTHRIMVIAKKTFDRKRAKSLADLKHLSTRDYGVANIVTDTVLYLLDTLQIDAGKYYGDNMVDEAIVVIDGDSIVTKIQKSKDKREFILTRQIYGGKNSCVIYLDIVETDRQRNWRYYIYRRLRVEPLPMNAD